jgi:hypothetical protein
MKEHNLEFSFGVALHLKTYTQFYPLSLSDYTLIIYSAGVFIITATRGVKKILPLSPFQALMHIFLNMICRPY